MRINNFDLIEGGEYYTVSSRGGVGQYYILRYGDQVRCYEMLEYLLIQPWYIPKWQEEKRFEFKCELTKLEEKES